MNWGSILKSIFKLLTGLVIVPLGILMVHVWPWWEKLESGPKKYFSAIFVLPVAGFMFIFGSLWDNW
jgi:hypothetical protein